MLPGKSFTPEDILRMAWRRRWFVIVPFVAIFAGTLVVSRLIPDRYRSETIILVVPQKVPESYVRSTVSTNIADRLRSIQQQILSRTRLELIIRDFDLYAVERKRLPMEDVVGLMRSDVRVDIVKGDVFRVAYTSNNPRLAMQVAERLATEFTKESLQDRELLASATTDFLHSQLEDARRRLAEQEAKVVDFQRRHAGSLPSERESNVQVLHNLQLQVQAVLESTNRDRDRRLFLERTLAELEPLTQAQPARPAAAGNPADPVAEPAGSGPIADQIEAARNALKTLELRLKPEHPDIVYLKRVIRDLESKARAEPVQQPSADMAARSPRPSTPEEQNRQRRLQETREELASVDIQLASRVAEERRLRDQISLVQSRVAATPGLEADLIAITRDYETLKKAYEVLLSKQEDSKLASALEQRQIGEVFKVIDPARLPESPASPNRPLIDLLGALSGLALGFGVVALLEYRDKSLCSEEDVLAVLKVPMLAAIPVIETRRDRRRARWRQAIEIAGAAAAAAVLVGAVLFAWSAGDFARLLSVR